MKWNEIFAGADEGERMIKYFGIGMFLFGIVMEIFLGTFSGLVFLFSGIVLVIVGIMKSPSKKNKNIVFSEEMVIFPSTYKQEKMKITGIPGKSEK